MNVSVDKNLIFDIGLHKGLDALYYLSKGFRVVGVEASIDLCTVAAEKTRPFADKMHIVNRALNNSPGRVQFYTVPDKDDWGSLYRQIAEKGVAVAEEISVDCINLAELFDEFGVPYYIKCDIEGGDLIFLEQLLADNRRPNFISVEMNNGSEGGVLRRCGYELGQIVNQWMNPFKIPPNPSREGHYFHTRFTGESSGLFGRELPPERWRPLDDIQQIYHRWKTLRDIDDELAPGWVDLHVTTASALC